MKKATVLLMALLMTVAFFSGCGSTAPLQEPSLEEPAAQVETAEPAVLAWPQNCPNLTLQTACYWNDYVVEIPLVVGVDTETIRQLNEEFAALAEEFSARDVTNTEEHGWIEWNSRLYPSEKYLQVVMTCKESPGGYGRDVQELKSWCYNIAEDRMIGLEEAMELAQLTAEQVETLFYEKGQQGRDECLSNITLIEPVGFRFVGDYNTEFYYMVTNEIEGAGSWIYLYALRCSNDSANRSVSIDRAKNMPGFDR